MIRRLLPLFLISLTLAAPVHAQLSSNRMMRLVVRDATSSAAGGTFGAQAKTMYRLGTRYGRNEEVLDTVRQLKGLIIVAEPKIWMINMITQTGQLLLDPGPVYDYHAPIVPEASGNPDHPLAGLEFGMEFDYMAAHKAKRDTVTLEGITYDRYRHMADRVLVTLLAKPGNRIAHAITISRGAAILADFAYDEYVTDLTPDMSLFEPPAGVTIQEPAPAAGKTR